MSHLSAPTLRPDRTSPSTARTVPRRVRTSSLAAGSAQHPAGSAHTAPPLPAGAVVAVVPAPPEARPVLTLVPALPSPASVVQTVAPTVAPTVTPTTTSSEEGSLVAEYGLLAVVAATVAGVLISWASSGALATFFGQLLQHARSLVVS